MREVTCPHEECQVKLKLGEGFGECEIGPCICEAVTLVVTDKKDARRYIRKPDALPLKKNDLVILRSSYTYLDGKGTRTTYSAEHVCKGGKSPRIGNGSPLDILNVIGVVRPGWKVGVFAPSADSIEEAIQAAWENRDDVV